MKKTYIQAIASYTEAAERLESLKESLGAEAVLKLQLEYDDAGGEQFVENTESVKCESKIITDSIDISDNLRRAV